MNYSINKLLFLILIIGNDSFGSSSVVCPQRKLLNGRVRYRTRSRFAKYSCLPGYILVGDRYTTCVLGHWDTPTPKCVKNTCSKVTPPANGIISPMYSGAMVQFFCLPGFRVHGPSSIYCESDKWSNNGPACLPTNEPVPLQCSFETPDLCGWTNDFNHDFDWLRMNHKTPSGHIGTGPSFDHTKGKNQSGYYMYIESSSRNEFDSAKLVSPIYASTTKNVCFEFYYHMYGDTTGTLNVYLKNGNASSNYKDYRIFFSKHGNQGDRWYRSLNFLGPITNDYQIVIVGIRGSGYISDTAIDDVRIIEDCQEESYTTTTENFISETTEDSVDVDSCSVIKCGNAEINNNDQIKGRILCDCDEYCTSNNTCCLDYLDVCVFVLSTTEDFSTTLDTYTSPPRLPDIVAAVTKLTTATTTKIASSTTRRKPIILQPPKEMNETIVEKVITKIWEKPTTSTKIVPDFKVVPTRPTIKESENSVEVINVLEKTLKDNKENDKQAFRTLPIENDKSGKLLSPFMIIVISVAAIISLIVIAILAIYRCISLKGMKSANGESQSDVRFLTSDEVIDFSLDRDYDAL